MPSYYTGLITGTLAVIVLVLLGIVVGAWRFNRKIEAYRDELARTRARTALLRKLELELKLLADQATALESLVERKPSSRRTPRDLN